MTSRTLNKAIYLLLVLGLLFSLPGQFTARAQSQTREIDEYILARMDELDIPGLAIAIVRGNQVEYMKGYGRADETGRAMTPQTPFLVASFSKPITALAVMQLVEQGKLELDAPVQTYLPWFRVADETSSSQITVRQLLNQTSGFPEHEGYLRNLDTRFSDDALEVSLRELESQALAHPPGTTFEYSNTNYDLLGLLVQTVSGQSYESYIQENIFTPLGMTNSYTSLAEARAANLASGYYSFFGINTPWEQRMPYTRIVVPSAGLFSSAEDMAHFLIAQMNGGQYNGQELLSPSGMESMHTLNTYYSENAGYGLGWVIFPYTQVAAASPDGSTPTGISHGGRWIGYRSLMVFIPELNLGMVILINKSDPVYGDTLDNIGWSIIMLALGLEPIAPSEIEFISLYGRSLLAGLILVLLAGLAWAAQKIRALSSKQEFQPGEQRKLLTQFGLLALFDLAVIALFVFNLIPERLGSLELGLAFDPDFGLLYVIILSLAIGGGILRSIFFARAFSQAK